MKRQIRNLIIKTDFESFGLRTVDGQLTNAGALFADGGKVYHSRIFATRWNCFI